MKELEKIKNRIQSRRGSSQEVVIDIEEVERKYSKPSKIYKIVMALMVLMAMFLSVAVYAKKDQNGVFLREKLGINVNFSAFNKTINKMLNFRTIENIANTSPVSNVPNYIHMGDDIYINGSSEVTSIDDGVVTYIHSDEFGYLVIVEHDSGFRSVYSNLSDVSVKINDRIYFESIIGVVEEQVKIVFSKDNKKITYEQVLELI